MLQNLLKPHRGSWLERPRTASLVSEVPHTAAPKVPATWHLGSKDPDRFAPEISEKAALKFLDAAAPEAAEVREVWVTGITEVTQQGTFS